MRTQINWLDRTHKKPKDIAYLSLAEQALTEAHLNFKSNLFLEINFVSAKQMIELNWELLQHQGDTDVITLDYRWHDSNAPDLLNIGDEQEPMGVLFICPKVAYEQSKKYKNRTYEKELFVYIVHGILHLCGYDDLEQKARKKMKYYERKIVEKCFKSKREKEL